MCAITLGFLLGSCLNPRRHVSTEEKRNLKKKKENKDGK